MYGKSTIKLAVWFFLNLSAWPSLAQTIFETTHINRYQLLQPYVPEGILIDRSPLSLMRSTQGIDPDAFGYGRQDTAHFNKYCDMHRLFRAASYTNHFPVNTDSIRQIAQEVVYGATRWSPPLVRQRSFDLILAAMHIPFREIAPGAFDSAYVYHDAAIDRYKLGLGTLPLNDTVYFDSLPHAAYTIVNTAWRFNDDQTRVLWSVSRALFMLVATEQVAYRLPGQPLRVHLPPELWQGVWHGVRLEVDFGDGQGYRPVDSGQSLLVSYSSDGLKNIRGRLKGRDGQNLLLQPSMAQIQVVTLKLGNPDEILQSGNPICGALASFTDGKATAYIKYGIGHAQQLRRPYVVVEGFEADAVVRGKPSEVPGDLASGFGQLNWTAFSSGVGQDNQRYLIPLVDYLDSIRRDGYDLIFVDFQTNRADIRSNARALVSILEQIKSRMTMANDLASIECLGISMGGLIARTALREMENHGCCHGVTLFTTFATPHRGANIPLGSQYTLIDLANRFNISGSTDLIADLLNHVLQSPAARQMLVYHHDTTAHVAHLQWLNYLDQLGMPRQSRNMAVTNGSVSGSLQQTDTAQSAPWLNPGDRLIYISREIWVPNSVPVPTSNQGYRSAGVNGMHLMRLEGFVAPHAPVVASGNLLYSGGDNLINNLQDVAVAHLVYAGSVLRLFKMMKSAQILATQQPAQAPLIMSVALFRAISYSLMQTRVLQQLINHNIQMNQGATVARYAIRPMDGLDYTAGDYTYAVDLNKSGFFSRREQMMQHGFVSTYSSLDIQGNPFQPVGLNLSPPIEPSTGFEGYISLMGSPDTDNRNSHHAFLHPFLMRQIKVNQMCHQYGHVASGLPRVLDSSVNYGIHQRHNRLTHTMNRDLRTWPTHVTGMGHLGINRWQPLWFSHSSADSLNGQYPDPNSRLVCAVDGSCSVSDILVSDGGQITLGEVLPGLHQTAQWAFRGGSRLILSRGSRLIVNHGSRLIIESDGILEVHAGAEIFLVGDSSILEIRGRVVLGNDARFGFQGNGHMVINHDSSGWSGGAAWTFGRNSGIALQGNGIGQVRARLLSNWDVMQSTAYFTLEQGSIRLEGNSRMQLMGPTRISQSSLTGDTTRLHRGLWLYGQPNVHISGSLFENGERAITSMQIGLANSLRITNCRFYNNHLAIETHGKSVQITSCFARNNNTFWRGYDIEGMSIVRNSVVSVGHHGIHVMGQHGAILNLSESQIDSHNTGVMAFGSLQLTAACASIRYNQTGIYAGNTHLFLSEDARNDLRYNQRAIYLEEADWVDFRNGGNNFSGSQVYVQGMLSGRAIHCLSPLGALAYGMNVAGNHMPATQIQQVWQLVDWDGNPVQPMGMQSFSGIGLCSGRQWPHPLTTLITPLRSSRSLVLNGRSVPIKSELLTLAAFFAHPNPSTTERMDILSRCNNLFASTRSQSTPWNVVDRIMLTGLLDAMIQCTSDGMVQLVESGRDAQMFYLPVQWILQEIDFRLSNPILGWSVELGHLQLRKAHVLRTGARISEALNVLNSVQNPQRDAWLESAREYWRCSAALELAFIRDQIGVDDLIQGRQSCTYLSGTLKQGQFNRSVTVQDKHEDEHYTCYPNPSSGIVWINRSDNRQHADVQVFDLAGRKVYQSVWSAGHFAHQVNLETLHSGWYTIVMCNTEGSKVALKLALE